MSLKCHLLWPKHIVKVIIGMGLLLAVNLNLLAHGGKSHGADGKESEKVVRQMLNSSILDAMANPKLTSLTVELKPGVAVPSHKHGAYVFVYVLEGKVLSQLNDDEAIAYSMGQTWIERPGDSHTLTQNLSDTEIAKILVVFIAEEGAKLTTSGEINN